MKLRSATGFTLIELMIVVAIIGILAAFAVPHYMNYMARSKFSEVIVQTAAAKASISLCFHEEADTTKCNGTGLPTDYPGMYPDVAPPGRGFLHSLTSVAGKITATGTAEAGNAVYILDPVVTPNSIHWTVNPTSSCLQNALCRE